MKFQPDSLPGTNAIARLEAGRIWVHQTPFTGSLIVPWAGEALPWPVTTVAEVTAELLAPVLALAPELLLIGTGERQAFVAARELRALIGARIGVECMTTAAAARTFNVLASEGRRVVGAFVLESGSPGDL